VVIGRRTSTSEDVDVHLGSSKMISRRHVQIEYNYEKKQWELCCLGKNPVIIDRKVFEPGSPKIPLKSKYVPPLPS
jgi:hypothetical protein